MCKPTINTVKVATKVDPNNISGTKDNCGPNLQQHPWYKQGGMKEVNRIGMVINIFTTLFTITRTMPQTKFQSWLTLLLLSYAFSAFHRKSLYCIFVVPTYFTSLLLCTSLDHKLNLQPQSILIIALAMAITKVNICMSVAYHRYAAHSAFKCGPLTNLFILSLGCLSWQGGPIWWSSLHRRHHKHCDVKGDPHSPVLDGTEGAFSFFERHEDIDEEFLPNHIDCHSSIVRLMDTWSWIFVAAELALVKRLGGLDGLFISFTSGWLCQAITLWFNVVNHPSQNVVKEGGKKQKELCQAINGREVFFTDTTYIPFIILDILHPVFRIFVMEFEHKHHHDHARLARRAKYDIAYWGFVWPLEKLGLVWNVIDS